MKLEHDILKYILNLNHNLDFQDSTHSILKTKTTPEHAIQTKTKSEGNEKFLPWPQKAMMFIEKVFQKILYN